MWDRFFGQKEFFDEASVQELFTTATNAVKGWLVNTAVKAVVQWVAPLLAGPAGGVAKVLQVVYKGLKWLVANGKKLLCILKTIIRGLKWVLRSTPLEVGKWLVELLQASLSVGLSLLAEQIGVGNLVEFVNGLVKELQEKVQGYVRKAIRKLLGKQDVVQACKTCPKPKTKPAATTAMKKQAQEAACAGLPGTMLHGGHGNAARQRQGVAGEAVAWQPGADLPRQRRVAPGAARACAAAVGGVGTGLRRRRRGRCVVAARSGVAGARGSGHGRGAASGHAGDGRGRLGQGEVGHGVSGAGGRPGEL